MQTKKDSSEYNRRYYQEHKKRIARKKHEKYKSDAIYRLSAIVRSKRSYARRLKSRSKKIGYTIKKRDGIELFSIVFITKLTGKTKQFIWKMEADGILPVPLYTDAREWRLYTEAQVKHIATALSNWDNDHWNINEVQQYLHDNWKEDNKNERRQKARRN